jgi:DNA-binding LytR/AlgR family response regulator
MTCIIVDDEPLARQGLELQLKNLSNITVKGSFSNALDAGIFLQNETADVIFLDINMPELNGMDFLKTLIDAPLVIFITAYPQYALDSYELDAVDYLVKPVRLERLIKAVNKADAYIKMLQPDHIGETAIESIEQDYVFIKADRKYTKVFFKEILYIEGLKDYVVVKLADKKLITAMNIKTIAGQLPQQQFARVNKSFIVNVNNILSVDSYTVYLQDEEIPIGESFKNDFLKTYVIGNAIIKK